MAQLQLVQDTYKGGMKRDGAREAMPAGSCWNLVDFLVETLGSLCRKRGGWKHISPDIHVTQPLTTWVKAGIVAEYIAGQSILAFDENGRVFWIKPSLFTGGSATELGVAVNGRNPLFYNDMVIVLGDGTTNVKKITRVTNTHTVADLGGSPPQCKYGLIYKDVVWMGGALAFPKRTYFSLEGDPESGANATPPTTWDLNVKWIDMSYPITGYAALSNAVLVFSLGRTARVRGSIPPPNGDFTIDDPVFEVGCTDNRSIVNYRDKCIFANAQGLYMTDGVALEDLTRVCGMKNWWRDVMSGRAGFNEESAPPPGDVFPGSEGYDAITWTIAGGVYGDFYFYSIMDGTDIIDAGMIDLTRYAWMRLSNIDSCFFFERLYPGELFWGRRQVARVANISDIFFPKTSNEVDGDTEAVEPELETAFFAGEPGLKTFQTFFITYDLTSSYLTPPELRVAYALTPEAETYADLAPDLAAELGDDGHHRTHLEMNVPGLGASFRIRQLGQSADTRLHTLEIAAQPRERSR